MNHEEVYNVVRTICGSILLSTMFLMSSCEDDKVEEPLVESIEMWVNGAEIVAREYYESIT